MKIPSRQEGDKEKATELILIYSEGEKTEPNYFRQFVDRIHAAYRNVVSVKVKGKGLCTMDLFNAIGNEVAKEIEDRGYGRGVTVWLVYDYDGKNDFDDMPKEAEIRNGDGCDVAYRLAWSNWCVELWFTLHFQDMPEANSLQQPKCSGYKKKLNKYLGDECKKDDEKISDKPYKKNDTDIFDKLLDMGNPKDAIGRAEKLVRQAEEKALCPSKANPCTHVHELVKELARYLPDELKARFIG